VEVDVGMLVQELSYECVLVCREVVEDDVDLLPGRAQGDDVREIMIDLMLRRPTTES
jgi:hypothetical protein